MAFTDVNLALATEEDAPTLASIVTVAFAASDAAFRLIWGSTPSPKWTLHEKFIIDGIFSPVQGKNRTTFKAIDSSTGKILGFSMWSLPIREDDNGCVKVNKKEGGSGGAPVLPGIDLSLFLAKFGEAKKAHDKYVDEKTDMILNMMFVHPDSQRQGIASTLLKWGIEKADELGMRLWLGSTPAGALLYTKRGWKVVELHSFDLADFGGEGSYERAWMLREAMA